MLVVDRPNEDTDPEDDLHQQCVQSQQTAVCPEWERQYQFAMPPWLDCNGPWYAVAMLVCHILMW